MTTAAVPTRAGTSLWWLPLTLGVVDVVLGVIVLTWPEATLAVVAVIFGLQLLAAGLVWLAKAALAGDVGTGPRVLAAVAGIAFLVVGVVCLSNLPETIRFLVFLIGIVWLVGGIADLVTRRSSADVIIGVVAVLAGLTVMVWPEESVRAFVWLLGIWLLILGVVTVVGAFRLRAAAGRA